MPQFTFLLVVLFVLIRDRATILFQCKALFQNPKSASVNTLLIMAILVLSSINYFFGFHETRWSVNTIHFTLLFIPTLIIAQFLRESDIRILLYCIAFECFISCVEFGLGVNTIFFWSPKFTQFQQNDLLYFSRPFGLSANSSVLAFKAFIGLLLLYTYSFKANTRKTLTIVLLATVIITFARTVSIALIVLFAILSVEYFFSKEKRSRTHWFVFGLLLFMVSIASIGGIVYYYDVIVAQFTRNTGTLEMSGREAIWPFFSNFVSEHFWIGNGSVKVWFDKYHAHNSFLQLLANHGIAIASAYFILIIWNLKRRNAKAIIPILIYSIAQYGIFWGVSLMDIVFFHFLLSYSPTEESNRFNELPHLLKQDNANTHNNPKESYS